MKNNIPIVLFMLLSLPLFSQTVSLELFASGFSSPLEIQNAGDDRLFVTEQQGVIKIMDLDGNVNATPFLNISGQVLGSGERGLLGLAFHPNYDTNGYFYVHYSDNSGDTQISRFSVSAGDPDIADAGSELMILNVSQPDVNHNGGTIAFGTDGYLYIALGDGGGSGDPDDNAQDLMLLIGKLLRIDVDNPGGGNNYGIPADNPFVGDPNAQDEIWAYGLRNPYRMSIDDEDNNIWIGDVGQNAVEEVNRASLTEAGLNYGWRCYEGSSPFNTTGCPPMGDLTFPVAEYNWNAGGSVIGGYVYRGSIYADLQEVYIFADLDGMIGTVDNSLNFINQGNFSGSWVGFGEDINEELYIVNIGGSIFKIQGDEIAATDDVGNPISLSMAPNPATETVSLSVSNDTIQKVTLVDIRGSILFSEENVSVSQKAYSIASLSEGIYLVNVVTENGNTFVKKLVKQ